MRASTTHVITDLPASPEDEGRARTRQYLALMAVRVLCLIVAMVGAVVAPGWWLLVPVLGATLLPFFAVVLANAPSAERSRIERPGPRGLGPAPDPR